MRYGLAAALGFTGRGRRKPVRPAFELPSRRRNISGQVPRLPARRVQLHRTRRTEARAKRTLDPPQSNQASARECGAASPPRALSPRRQEWDDKGKALALGEGSLLKGQDKQLHRLAW